MVPTAETVLCRMRAACSTRSSKAFQEYRFHQLHDKTCLQWLHLLCTPVTLSVTFWGDGKRSSFEVRTQHTEARPPSFISTPLKHGEQLRGVGVYVTDSIGALPGQVMAGDVNRNAQGDE
jgi:hypothetical protein